MHGAINVKFPNNISKWQVGFNSAFKGLIQQNLPFTKPGHYGNLNLAEIFYSPEDPTWTFPI
jgi:hypothetical protein